MKKKYNYFIEAEIGTTVIRKEFNAYDDWILLCEHLVEEIRYTHSSAYVCIFDNDDRLIYDADYDIVDHGFQPIRIIRDFNGFSVKHRLNEVPVINTEDIQSSLFSIMRFLLQN